ADRIVVAAGSRPSVPGVITASGVPFHTSETIMRIDELPQRMLIVGGGFIAAEFAHVFSALGVDVTVITRGPARLRSEHAEISAASTKAAASRWRVHLDAEVASAVRTQRGVRLDLTDGTRAEGDLLLVATGRHSNADRLDPAAAGIDLHPDGRIKVDSHG